MDMGMRGRSSSVNLFWAIAISSFVAFVLTVVSPPDEVFYFWPDWVALVVIYWALIAPDRVGPVFGFFMGTLLEVLSVSEFGVLGLGLATIAFIVNSAHLQIKVLSMWQQMVLVGLFVGFFKLITGWLYGVVGDFTITFSDSYSLIGCILVWPFVFILLQELRRISGVR